MTDPPHTHTHPPTNRQDRLQYTAPQLARRVKNRRVSPRDHVLSTSTCQSSLIGLYIRQLRVLTFGRRPHSSVRSTNVLLYTAFCPYVSLTLFTTHTTRPDSTVHPRIEAYIWLLFHCVQFTYNLRFKRWFHVQLLHAISLESGELGSPDHQKAPLQVQPLCN